MNRSGHTLPEVIMVVLIAGVVMVSAPPIFQWMRQQGAKHAANQLCADLQQARMMAIQQKQSCSLVFNSPGRNRYTNTLSNRTRDLADYKGGVHFLDSGPDNDAMSDSITFHRRGMAAPAGDIYLSDAQGASIFRIVVLAPGGISLYRWDSGRWH